MGGFFFVGGEGKENKEKINKGTTVESYALVEKSEERKKLRK